MKKLLSICSITAVILLSGCVVPLRGGRAVLQTPSGIVGAVEQPQNPRNDSQQTWEREERTDGTVTEKVTTIIGASQKDVAREMAAKLSSLRPVMYLGIVVFLFGIASAVWPPLKLIISSVTTSAVIAAAGLALIVLPTVIVGHEMLIMVGSLGAALAWFFAHRHGQLRGFVDANKDGIDDRKQ